VPAARGSAGELSADYSLAAAPTLNAIDKSAIPVGTGVPRKSRSANRMSLRTDICLPFYVTAREDSLSQSYRSVVIGSIRAARRQKYELYSLFTARTRFYTAVWRGFLVKVQTAADPRKRRVALRYNSSSSAYAGWENSGNRPYARVSGGSTGNRPYERWRFAWDRLRVRRAFSATGQWIGREPWWFRSIRSPTRH